MELNSLILICVLFGAYHVSFVIRDIKEVYNNR